MEFVGNSSVVKRKFGTVFHALRTYSALALAAPHARPGRASSFESSRQRGLRLRAGLVSSPGTLAQSPLSTLVLGSPFIAGRYDPMGLCLCLAYEVHGASGVHVESAAICFFAGDLLRNRRGLAAAF